MKNIILFTALLFTISCKGQDSLLYKQGNWISLENYYNPHGVKCMDCKPDIVKPGERLNRRYSQTFIGINSITDEWSFRVPPDQYSISIEQEYNGKRALGKPEVIVESENKRVAYLDKDSNLVVIDTMATIKALIRGYIEIQKSYEKQQSDNIPSVYGYRRFTNEKDLNKKKKKQ